MPVTPIISIVDDDDSVREALMGLMRSLGSASEAYRSAEDFLSLGGSKGTSCLIADVRMTGMTGFELHRHLVAANEQIPTVLITAHYDEETRKRALDAGVICCLTKPFKEDELLACIHLALERGTNDGTGT